MLYVIIIFINYYYEIFLAIILGNGNRHVYTLCTKRFGVLG